MKPHYFKRFNSISLNYLYTDKHMHSTWTDGKGTVLQMAEKAKELGLKQIAFVDHVREDSAYFTQYCKEIKAVCKKINIDILAGCEMKIKNFQGDIDIPKDVMKNAELKVVSVHRFPLGRKLYQPNELNKRICQEVELELSIAAIRNKRFDVLGHPGGMSLMAYREFPLEFFEEIILECQKNDIVFELNSFYHVLVLKDLKTLLSRHNAFVSFGSDAHRIEEIEESINILKRVITDE